ncbi:hypothetical protein BG004_004122 [Podila humilis]|nr:hypothetical protein BG004_004122 [Podila humilis]
MTDDVADGDIGVEGLDDAAGHRRYCADDIQNDGDHLQCYRCLLYLLYFVQSRDYRTDDDDDPVSATVAVVVAAKNAPCLPRLGGRRLDLNENEDKLGSVDWE